MIPGDMRLCFQATCASDSIDEIDRKYYDVTHLAKDYPEMPISKINRGLSM